MIWKETRKSLSSHGILPLSTRNLQDCCDINITGCQHSDELAQSGRLSRVIRWTHVFNGLTLKTDPEQIIN